MTILFISIVNNMTEKEKIKNVLHLVFHAIGMLGGALGRGISEELTPTLEEFIRQYTKDEETVKSLLEMLQKDDEKELEQLINEILDL